jgi:hypothetical protein
MHEIMCMGHHLSYLPACLLPSTQGHQAGERAAGQAGGALHAQGQAAQGEALPRHLLRYLHAAPQYA